MSGPAWLAGSFAVLMVVIAGYCVYRLAISWLQGKDTERDADALHVLMGAAMAGMLEPRLTPVPGAAWRLVFVAAAAWFAWQAIRAGRRGAADPRGANPAPHAIESAAMVYMLLPVGSWPSGHGPGMAMPGMNQGATAGNPALTLVLALFMLGYVLWGTDRLARLARASAVAPVRGAAAARPLLAAVSVPAAASVSGAPSSGAAVHQGSPGRAALAPGLAAGYKVAMGMAMGYMLVMML